MRIGIVDVDGHNFPNLALMKISAYHKAAGDSVEWANSLEKFDKIYMAKVFTFTPDDLFCYQCEDITRGGTGYDLKTELPEQVERCYPDYSIYGVKDTAYGYLTRGCPRGCPFCIVAEKEGRKSRKVANLDSFWNKQKYIKLLDPNILACNQWPELFEQLKVSRAWVDFTQGLDIRIMDDEKAAAVRGCKLKMLHFAWDNPDDKITPEKLKEYASAFGVDKRKMGVYVLTNFNSTHEQDVYRVEKIKELGYLPYIMIYNKAQAPRITKQLQRYVNNRYIFWSCPSFSEYLATAGGGRLEAKQC